MANLVCDLCGAPAKAAEFGKYRHAGEPWEDGSGFCERYGYPIPVRTVCDSGHPVDPPAFTCSECPTSSATPT